ncbi:MAG: hypothetical protein ACI83D_000592 [Planctomycetota bacterium]|jgi:hypothetical protein
MKKYAQIIIWLVVLAVIVVLAVTGGSNRGGDDLLETEVVSVGETETSEVLDEVLEQVDEEAVPVSTSLMTPYVDGGFTYNFETFTWELFDTEIPGQTKVNFRLTGFTRILGGAPANLARPFGVASYPGTCKEVSSLAIEGVSGTPLAYLECSDGETLVELVAVQDTASGNLIHVMQRAAEAQGFMIARTLDMTKILK